MFCDDGGDIVLQTPVEEILRSFDDLVRAGKVLYIGISDSPAWQASRMQAIAELRGWSPLVALQIPYNLTERTVERDLIPMAREMGMGVLPLQFKGGDSVEALGIRGDEEFDVVGLENIRPQMDVTLVIRRSDGSRQEVPLLCRIDTPVEVDYYRHGGILPYVLRALMAG